MLSVIRRNQHSLTFLIVLLTIVSFIWLYNRTNLSQVGANDVALAYGHIIQRAEIELEARRYRLAMALGLTDLVRDLGGFAENEEMAITSFIFNSLVLHQEAPRLGVIPTDDAIAQAIQALPLFQSEGAFDRVKYATLMKEQLAPRGFTERDLENVVRDSLRLKMLSKMITGPVTISEAQIKEAARIYQPVTAQVLRFDTTAYINKVTVTAEEKNAFYEKNKASMMSEEQRSIAYVAFELTPDQKKLESKARVQVMQQLSEKATELKQKGQEGGEQGLPFEKIATNNGFKVITTENFTKNGKSVEETPSKQKGAKELPAHEKIVPELAQASFKLTHVGDISEIIQGDQRFYLAALVKVAPVRQLSFSEVESKIEAFLKQQKARQQIQEAADKAHQAIAKALQEGKKFAEAVALTGLKAELLSGVSPIEAKAKLAPQQQECVTATIALNEGDLSEVKHASWGDFIVYLQGRSPLSNSDWMAHKEAIGQEFLEQQQELVFFEWLHKARNDAKITMIDRKQHRNLLKSIFGR